MTNTEYKRLRQCLGSQRDVAKWLGMTYQSLSRRENNGPISVEAEYALKHLASLSLHKMKEFMEVNSDFQR